MDVLLALVLVLIALWVRWRWQITSTFQKLNIPGPKPNIFFGNLVELYRKGPIECHKEWVEKYGRIVGFYYGMTPVLLVTDPQILKNIFIRDFPKFINREVFNPIMKYNPHNKNLQSVLNLPGQAWKDIRSVLTPTFTTAKMKQMAGSINSSISELINTFEGAAGGTYDVYDAYQRLTMDVITRTAFGVKTDVQTNHSSKMMQYTKSLFLTPFKDPIIFVGMAFPLVRSLCNRLQELILAIINQGVFPHTSLRKGLKDVLDHRRNNPQGKKADLLQLMIDAKITTDNVEEMSKLEAGNVENEQKYENKKSEHFSESNQNTREMTDDEIVSSAFTVFLAGYETTSTALGFTTYLLAKHPDVQENLFQEIEQLIQSGQSLEYGTINKLSYLDKVLNESMRIYPPVIFFTNRYAMEDMQYGDLKIPKGTLINAPVFFLHHDPELWTDPETFDPERFNDKPNTDGITYLPFGVGPRNCLGLRLAQLEAKLALANVVHKFRFHLTSEENLATVIRLRMLAPKNGVHLRIERRDI